jgi:hypothetical protein
VEEAKPSPGELPSYLLGTYERGARVENSMSVDSEDRAVRFEAGNRYYYRTARIWDLNAYDVSVTDNAVRFETGPLMGKQLALSSVSPNCRIVLFDGDRLFRGDEVAECPMSARSALSASSCQWVGSWRKTTRSGPLGELLEVALSVELQPDHFFVSSTSTVSCHTGDCRFDAPLPQVGTWSDGDGTVVGPDLSGLEHLPVKECASLLTSTSLGVVPILQGLPAAPPPGAPPAAVDYGRCTSDQQCIGMCGQTGACTALCKYDVECVTPGEGIIAICQANRCMASCAAGNACPGGTVCRDGLCL